MKRLIFFIILLTIPFFAFSQFHLSPPFYHGVASGDPLTDAVIIWTRVTPINSDTEIILGKWQIATDIEMENVIQTGDFATTVTKDFTVKIDVQNLESNTYYYYQFESLEKKSIIGRTKTAPKANDSSHLRFAVVSCNNYEDGYFNAFRAVANQHDLDAVLHLGDYIYESHEGHKKKSIGRTISPTTEAIDLKDYRMRYNQYRLDVDFIKVHQQHPFICIWDDHETANDSYKNGAQNHQPKWEGKWEDRKTAAKRAYFEWLPIRNHPQQKINRILKYGELADLIMLDTRLEGRDKKPNDMYAPSFMDSSRVMLGDTQRQWLFDALKNSTAKWKIIGQQVVFSELNVGWANPLDRLKTENYLLDIWDGYPVERLKIIDYLKENQMENVVFLSGDFHTAFGFEVTANPREPMVYNPKSSKGSVAVEFVTPSISSSNFNEAMSNYQARKFEECLNQSCRGFPFFHKKNPNPHIKYVDLDRNGFIILDITEAATQANFYFVNSVDIPTDEYYFDAALRTKSGENHLNFANENKSKPFAIPAFIPKEKIGLQHIISGIYQKDDNVYCQIHSINANYVKDFCLVLDDENGNKIKAFSCDFKQRTVYTARFTTNELPKGKYYLVLEMKQSASEEKYFFEIK